MLFSTPYALLTALLFLITLFFTPRPRADLLIFSPHPDDATLCCAGLIQQSLAQGKTVHVVDITDGDGFLEAAQALFGSTSSANMKHLGIIRRKEEVRAMSLLGLSRGNITFLGYPDGWLPEVYANEEEGAFVNPYTQRSSTHTHVPYTKQSLLADITSLITKHQPTEIYVSDAKDNVLDHSIVGLAVLNVGNNTGYSRRIHTYVIHTNRDHADVPMTITLTNAQKQRKARAVEAYTSQTAVEGEYLRWFVQGKEVFYRYVK